MNFTNLLHDDDAVSPVIGVILMVAITVILAAVIGTFVLGLGDQVSNTSPSVSFTFDFDDGVANPATEDSFGTGSGGDGVLTITHDGGDKVPASQLSISGSTPVGSVTFPDSNSGSTGPTYTSGDDITAGDSIEIAANSDDTIRVTWEASGGGDTATLGKWTGPDA